jgi:DNA adenine methylase
MSERRTFEVKDSDAKALTAYAALPVVVVAGRTPGDLIDALWARMARARDLQEVHGRLYGGVRDVTNSKVSSPARPRPFLKWAGGKTQLLPELLKRVPTKFRTYYEPFLGGGALFWALRPPLAVLADLNQELVNAYLAVQRDVAGVVRELESLFAGHCGEQYGRVRAEGSGQGGPCRSAARTIYLNKTCFNGLYRVNSRGEFNVPVGRYAKPPACDADNLRACSALLRSAVPGTRGYAKTRVLCADFRAALEGFGEGDFAYLDPPYAPVSKTSSFTAFTAVKFGPAEHEVLADLSLDLKRRGGHVLLSGPDTPESVALYESRGLRVEHVLARRNINSKGGGRGVVGEILVT